MRRRQVAERIAATAPGVEVCAPARADMLCLDRWSMWRRRPFGSATTGRVEEVDGWSRSGLLGGSTTSCPLATVEDCREMRAVISGSRSPLSSW